MLRIPQLIFALMLSLSLWPASGTLAPITAAAAGEKLTLAFYYPWFDMNTWTDAKVPDYPVPLYISSERSTIVRHVNEGRRAGLSGFVSAWAGRGNQTESNFATLLSVSQGTDFRSTIYFETHNFTDQGAVVDSLRHLLSTHASHPNFLRYQGKPVLFFWALRQVPKAPGQSNLQAWRSIRDQVDPQRTSVWIGEGDDPSFLQVFDGIHMYSIAWAANPATTLSNYARKVRNTSAQLGVPKLWVATAMPGYDDWRTGRTDAFSVDRRGGDYYRTTFRGAIATDPDWIIITSFNEWVEGSMIEPSRSYGDLYLNITAEGVARFKDSGPTSPTSAVPLSATGRPDWDVSGGHFYTQTNGRGGNGGPGFAITDADGVPLWSEYQRLGGVAGLGYPVSRRFMWNGFVVQATQRAVLQWRPEAGQVYLANVFDALHDQGKDPWLQSFRSTPPSFDTGPDQGLTWDQVVDRHLAFLDTNPSIRSVFWQDSDPLLHYGLPMAYADYGNVYVIRFQRAVFQQWKVDVPWASAGQVTIANGGDLALEAGLFDPNVAQPEAAPN